MDFILSCVVGWLVLYLFPCQCDATPFRWCYHQSVFVSNIDINFFGALKIVPSNEIIHSQNDEIDAYCLLPRFDWQPQLQSIPFIFDSNCNYHENRINNQTSMPLLLLLLLLLLRLLFSLIHNTSIYTYVYVCMQKSHGFKEPKKNCKVKVIDNTNHFDPFDLSKRAFIPI